MSQVDSLGIPIVTTVAAMERGGLRRRASARFVDGIILSVVTFPLSMFLMASQTVVASVFKDSGLAPQIIVQILTFLLSTVLNIVYYAWFYSQKGGTPGKLLLGLKVVDHETGTHIGWGKTALRETFAMWIFSAGLLFLGLTFWIALARDDRRTVADLISGTQVLHQKKS